MTKFQREFISSYLQAIRQFIEKGLSITSYEQSQTEIRNYIREEIETVMPIVMKRYMERLIAMQ